MVYETEFCPQSQYSLPTGDSKLTALAEDAIAKIQIKPDFTIVHAEYQPIKVSQRYRDYLARISVDERDRYFITSLEQYLYDIFSGRLKPNSSIERCSYECATDESNLQDEIVNNTNSWHKTKFFHQLTQCNHSRGYKDAGWLVIEKDKTHWLVFKDGLTINIDPQKHFLESGIEPQVGHTVSLEMPPNLVERGLYIAVGNAGSTSNLQPSSEQAIAQLYFNVDAKTSLVLLDNLTRQLNSLIIPFDFKIPYSENNFGRSDAPVLEFIKGDLSKVEAIVRDIHSNNAANFKPEVPFFCQELAPGLGLAEKPCLISDNNWENAGFKYCHSIAKTILKINKS